jgi:hypothetical protein
MPTWSSSSTAGPLSAAVRRRRDRLAAAGLSAPTPLLGMAPPQTFSQIFILSVDPPVQNGADLLLSWTSNAPAGLVFQVYVNLELIWAGPGTSAEVRVPDPPGSPVRIDIGTVGLANEWVDYSSLLPVRPKRSAELTWLGGTYEAADIAGFHVYGEHTPGGGIDYTAPLASVPVYTAGIINDGYGYGGFGQGGYGAAAGSYSWTSGTLSTGTWAFAVLPFDAAGNEGTAQRTTVAICAPPLPPAPFADRSRLHYTYSSSAHKAMLTWNASPA